MITEALIVFVMRSIAAVVGLLPVWTVPVPELGVMSSTVTDAAARGNGYFPLVLTLSCVALVLAVKTGLFAWRTVIFIYHQFWGSS